MQTPPLNNMSKKYIAKAGFHNPVIGRKEAGEIVEDSQGARDSYKDGYLNEYKTKVIIDKPKVIKPPKEDLDKESPKKTVTKKTSKKSGKK